MDDVISDAVGHGYRIVYVDYVQLLRVSGVRDSDGYARVTAASQALKVFSQNTNTAVIALAQLTRPSEKSSNGRNDEDPSMPTMTSFKESGQLEQDADVAFLVFPSSRKDNDSQRIFRIVKNKEGARPDPVRLMFYGDVQTMVELEPEPDHSVAAELAAGGRAIKARNHAKAQAQYQEVEVGDEDNPFAI